MILSEIQRDSFFVVLIATSQVAAHIVNLNLNMSLNVSMFAKSTR